MTEPSIERYFAVLGLPSNASEEEVKEARNFVTKAFHPDKYQAGSKDQMKATQRQIEINEAYERLMSWFEARKKAETVSRSALDRSAKGKSQAWHKEAGANPREKTIAAVKIVLLLALALAWIGLINASYSRPSLPQNAGISSSTNADRISQTSARPTPGAELDARASAPSANAGQVPHSDWLFLLLILSTLALSWFLFAPESQLLIDRWTRGAGGHEPFGNRGVGPN